MKPKWRPGKPRPAPAWPGSPARASATGNACWPSSPPTGPTPATPTAIARLSWPASFTAEETAEILGIGRSKVYELLRAGAIQSVRIGACRRIPAAAIIDNVERLRREAAAGGANDEGTGRARSTGGRMGRWTATIDLGWQGGKRRRKFLHGKTRAEVAQKLAVALKAHRDGQVFGDKRTMVEQFLHAWLGSVEPSVGPRTWTSYEELIRRHAVPHIGKVRLTRLGARHLDQLYGDLVRAGLSRPRSCSCTGSCTTPSGTRCAGPGRPQRHRTCHATAQGPP
jgi:excisionase family DNA binding protein